MAIISEIDSMLSRSSAVCQPLLYSMLPVIPALAARARNPAILRERLLHLALGTHDADQVLHDVLKLALHRKRILASRSTFERRQSRLCCGIDIRGIHPGGSVGLSDFRGVLARAFPKDEKIGKRISA